MAAKLYAMSFSHPSNAVAKMLEIKGIDCRRIDFLPGTHPLGVHLAGFRGGTVPALKLDGQRVQGSTQISRVLDQIRPEPPLFPADPDQRRRVEEAERWGDTELQPSPRRLFRWGLVNNPELRTWFTKLSLPGPLAGPLALATRPQARQFARKSHANEAQARLTLDRLPARLDHVDELIAAGVIGGEPNAADLQIASTLRVLLAFADTRAALEGRPAGELAMRLFPRFPAGVPHFLPSDWLSPLHR